MAQFFESESRQLLEVNIFYFDFPHIALLKKQGLHETDGVNDETDATYLSSSISVSDLGKLEFFQKKVKRAIEQVDEINEYVGEEM